MKNNGLKDNLYGKKLNETEDKNGANSNINKSLSDKVSVKKYEGLCSKSNENTLVLLNNRAKVMMEDFNSNSIILISRSLWCLDRSL